MRKVDLSATNLCDVSPRYKPAAALKWNPAAFNALASALITTSVIEIAHVRVLFLVFLIKPAIIGIASNPILRPLPSIRHSLDVSGDVPSLNLVLLSLRLLLHQLLLLLPLFSCLQLLVSLS